MLRNGARLTKISKRVFQTTSVSTLKLWGGIWQRAALAGDGSVVSSVTERDFRKTGARPKDTQGAIDYLNMVPQARYSMLITDRNDGKVKGSLRTLRDEVNVSEIASRFGGGGHVKAAGFMVKGHLQIEHKYTIIPE